MFFLLILSDDYTGSLDTGVQFADIGLKTTVIHDPTLLASAAQTGDVEVLVVDTETRHLPPEEAYTIVYAIARQAYALGVPYVYKKTDSALRGNVGAELSAVLAASGGGTLFFVPSFPSMNRILRNGIYYIEETPVSESLFAQDPFNPVLHSDIRSLLGSQTDVPVISMAADDPMDRFPPGILACDAATTDDMRQLGRLAADQSLMRAMAGCAGFAQIVAEQLRPKGLARESGVRFTEKFPAGVVLCGSLNNKSREQIEYAQRCGCPVFFLSSEEILHRQFSSSPLWRNSLTEAARLTASGGSCIFCTRPPDPKENTSVEHPAEVAAALGLLGCQLLRLPSVRTLYVIGGDTLIEVIRHAGIQAVSPKRSRNKGVVIAEIEVAGQKKHLISKSGGLGTQEAITELIQISQEDTHEKT